MPQMKVSPAIQATAKSRLINRSSKDPNKIETKADWPLFFRPPSLQIQKDPPMFPKANKVMMMASSSTDPP